MVILKVKNILDGLCAKQDLEGRQKGKGREGKGLLTIEEDKSKVNIAMTLC